ncbi:hypothetical protein [Amycolatopsis tolypomycina]|uniref:hypothetical protein n=1 Tax=Amycolatopsis tolypomycina TaxID=208445 RepID=UPI00115FA12C|nr:hypothetical protein [Amycolatopsis tolypomycina]
MPEEGSAYAGIAIPGGHRAAVRGPTPARLPAVVDAGAPAGDPFAVVLPLRAHGSGDPRLCLPPPTGLTGGYAGLLRTFGGRPVYGLQCRGLRGEGGLPGSPAELVTAVAVPRGRGSHRAS